MLPFPHNSGMNIAMKLASRLSACEKERLEMLSAEALYQALLDEGDFIEMGVFRGGSAVLLASALRYVGSKRKLHLLDSWEGLPELHQKDEGSVLEQGVFGSADEDGVRQNLAHLGLADYATLNKGWFEETITMHEGPFSLAHVDGDLYQSVRTCLDHVLPRMTEHGVVVVDDFGRDGDRNFPGVIQAVSESIEGSGWVVSALSPGGSGSVKLTQTIPVPLSVDREMASSG